MALTTSNPYTKGDTFKQEAQIVDSQRGKAQGKVTARYPHKPLTPKPGLPADGKVKTNAI